MFKLSKFKIYFIMFKYLCFLLIFNSVYAQEKEIYVEYNQLFDNARKIERKAFLYGNNEGSIYEDDLVTNNKIDREANDKKQAELDKQNAGTNRYSSTIIPVIKYNQFLKLNQATNSITFIEQLVKDRYIHITDEVQQNWKLTNEKKMISGMECFKATTTFRGIQWEAWYTTTIPYSFGPWKLHGLPGLIIQANDVNKRYNYNAVKIEFKKNVISNKKLTELVSENIAEKLTLKQFIAQRDEIRSAPLEVDRDTRVERKTNLRYGQELIYEWEENK